MSDDYDHPGWFQDPDPPTHSPGPWKWSSYVDPDDGTLQGSIVHEPYPGHSYAIAVRPRYVVDAQWEPDARLIAAAPDLLAVAKGYEAWEAKLVLDNNWNGPDGLPCLTQSDYDELMQLQELRNVAIAKATGND